MGCKQIIWICDIQKLSLDSFKWIEEISRFKEYFIKRYNDDINGGYFIEADVPYPENFHNLCNDLLFLPERIKIENVEKNLPNIRYIVKIRTLKQSLNYGLILKRVHRVIQTKSLVKTKS